MTSLSVSFRWPEVTINLQREFFIIRSGIKGEILRKGSGLNYLLRNPKKNILSDRNREKRRKNHLKELPFHCEFTMLLKYKDKNRIFRNTFFVIYVIEIIM